MSKRYVVTGEYITMQTRDMLGNPVVLGFYRGALVPEDVSQDSIDHHLSTNQIQEVEVEVTPVEDAEGNKLGEGAATTEFEDKTQTEGPGEVADGLGDPNTMATLEPMAEPKRTDKREAWVEYAVSKGADRADIEEQNVSRADLIATWGTPK